jgi:hypothetical protein
MEEIARENPSEYKRLKFKEKLSDKEIFDRLN